MFGKKKEEIEVSKVPVYTVHSLPRKYEVLQTVHVDITTYIKSGHDKLLDALGIQGAEIGADAVIGVIFQIFNNVNTHAFGTAIKYVD